MSDAGIDWPCLAQGCQWDVGVTLRPLAIARLRSDLFLCVSAKSMSSLVPGSIGYHGDYLAHRVLLDMCVQSHGHSSPADNTQTQWGGEFSSAYHWTTCVQLR